MAGIGFELKKLFNRRGLFATFRAYGYAGVVCTGPMLLGVVLLLGVMFLCGITGGSRHSRELLVCMITYTLLASLTVTSFLSMVVTRFIADQLYEENYEAVLPSFWGSSGLMLIVGGILYGVFLIFSGAGLLDGFLCFGFFGELIITWNAMSYLTAIKDYRGILLAFIAAILVTFLTGWILLMTGIPHVEALLIAVSVGYGVMMVSVFSIGKCKRLFLSEMGGSVFTTGIYGSFYQYRIVCASGDHVDGTTAGKSTGAFCRGAVP